MKGICPKFCKFLKLKPFVHSREKEEEKMQQRKSTYGRPTGTDGSNFSYCMVVESRYQRVAEGKSHLSKLIFVQIEHAQHLTPRTADQFGELGIIASVQDQFPHSLATSLVISFFT
ncbi:uncharacterized protein LOC133818250 [Humulus lupulus]|uniref:uncharacterized protein LOC133818250 n=1 Tax=Humulus lupulus TaxID=3486 RepID=UPI002B40DAF8|nr:uncharacterized protein LOC133818250 [Humulus lupulus]